jgi:arginine decarboxylase
MKKTKYIDLINQTFYFPQEGFRLVGDQLIFNDIDLAQLIKKYGTPLKITYLPKIGAHIERARGVFNSVFEKLNYKGKYFYTYVTKTCHFKYVIDEVLKHKTHLETSSAFDIDLIRSLYKNGQIQKDAIILHNGFKPLDYAQKICGLINDGFSNVIPILDNKRELELYKSMVHGECNIGIRVATEQEPNAEFYTSRLGMRRSSVIDFYKEKIATNPKFKLKMLHFFVDNGIKDSVFYWSELKKAIDLYCDLKAICPTLEAFNIGGGMPIRTSLHSDFDFTYMVEEIVTQIQQACQEDNVPEPHIYSEFGKYTVGESGATILKVIGKKQQNDSELWYMVDNSIINCLPDTWFINQRFILLPINKWTNPYTRVNIGGITCDHSDYYNSEVHIGAVFLPQTYDEDPEPLYVGFFHTGAYQDSLSGYGGIKHCLIPAPKHVILDRDQNGNLTDRLNFDEQKAQDMLAILGY